MKKFLPFLVLYLLCLLLVAVDFNDDQGRACVESDEYRELYHSCVKHSNSDDFIVDCVRLARDVVCGEESEDDL